MLMLSRAHEVRREDLAAIPTPEPTGTWRPVPHHEVVSTLTRRAQARGLRLAAERYALLDGTLYPRPGAKVALPGARLFGALDFEPFEGLPFPPGCRPSAGVRNSHDKSFALSILAGSRVVVCANGLLLAEHVINRKHTSGLALEEEIDTALDAFLATLRGFKEVHARLQALNVTQLRAHHLIIELARAGAFPSSDILEAVREWEEPRHPEFRDRNAWSLHQAATEVMKDQSPARQVEGLKALSSVLLPLAS